MTKTLPGTEIPIGELNGKAVDDSLGALFAAGGIVLSQVTALTGLEPYTVQNWVKRKFVSPPIHRLYTERQFCRIVIINMLRETMQLDAIVALLSYINGVLGDESDDLIDDSRLYRMFVRQLAALRTKALVDEEVLRAAEEATSDYCESIPGSRERIMRVLAVMTYAYRAAKLSRHTGELLKTLI